MGIVYEVTGIYVGTEAIPMGSLCCIFAVTSHD